MADICATAFSFLPLTTYASAASFCASYSCTDLTSTHTSTATFTNLLTSTTAPVATVTAVTTVVNNITESTTTTSTLSLTSIVGTTTVTATLTPVSPAAVVTTVTVTTTVTPLAKRNVCTVRPPKCSTFMSTEIISKLVTRPCSTESPATIQPATFSTVSEQVSRIPPHYPAEHSTTSYHDSTEKPSKSVCRKRTKTSKKTTSGSTIYMNEYAASGPSSAVSARPPPASASVSISSRVYSSVDPLVTLLSSLQGLPSSAISTACACLEGYECRTTHIVTTTTVTLPQTVIITAPVTTFVTATASNQLTTTITAVVTTTLTFSSTTTVTTTQVLPSFTPTIITSTTTTTTTAAPQPTEVCGSGKSFTVYAGRTIEGQFIFASGAGSFIDFCATICGGYTRCEGFDFNAGTNVCRYYGTRVKSMPGTLAEASTYQTIPNPDYTAGIWTGNC